MKQAMKDALDCYKTYTSAIEESGVIEKIKDELLFEFFDGNIDPPLGKLTDNLPE